MKTKGDPRHKTRVSAVKSLFSASFLKYKGKATESTLEARVLSKVDEIDKLIVTNAPAWPLEQIAPLDLAVLRLAIYELVFKKDKEPYKVIVDEAVEIAKEFGNSQSGAFVNGVLGSIIKTRDGNQT